MFLLTVCDVTYLEDGYNYDRAYEMVSEYRRNKADRLKAFGDKVRCVASGLLLNATLSMWCGGESVSEELNILSIEQVMTKYDRCYDYDIFTVVNGKPVFIDHEDIHFNISHAGKYVVCVVSDGQVGIDIEGGREVRLKVAERFFSREECEWIEQGERTQRFLRLWTAREAYGKLVGEGIARTMGQVCIKCSDSLQIVDNGVLRNEIIIREYTIGDDYYIAMAKYERVG